MDWLGPEGETPRELFADKPRELSPAALADLAKHAEQQSRTQAWRDNRNTSPAESC
jgi:hypothetical protein